MGKPHVVIFPYDEQGHVTPAFALGRALASRGIRVTGVLSAARYARSSISSSSYGDGTTLLQVVKIPDGVEEKDGDICFQHSLQWLEPGLSQLLLGLQPRPSCLISDFLYPWSQDLADRIGLPRFQFCVFPAISYLIVFHVHSFIAKGLLPFRSGMEDEMIDFIPGLVKGFRLANAPVDGLCRDEKQLEVWSRLQCAMKRGAGVVINTVHDLERDALNALSAEGLSLYAVGPLSSIDWSTGNHIHTPSILSEDEVCLLWLNSQPLCSVIYAAFGSMISLSKQEIQEIALGLEACGQPFLWVLRSSGDADDTMSALPVGFLERTKGKGRVISWAPQTAVLSHVSVGCFLCHCGMGSVMDALWAGVPMVAGFYKISDQNTIFRLITEDWKVAMAIQDRHDQTGDVSPLRNAIETCVKEVLHGERGVELRLNVSKIKGMMRKGVEPGGCSYQDLGKLVNEIISISNVGLKSESDSNLKLS